ncbi:hypothetical protein BDM02DRAFT_3272225 [Thelephora ganbajun]|uniref:Uncharacterized protein n=1 Tax=Thelephora ganbajun TaxID=370292 RepID=A0ACB6Z4Z8_THEGA|nr:hypothetical protein BDM02DRAFT_3272225 [Thelephora ganbajun]
MNAIPGLLHELHTVAKDTISRTPEIIAVTVAAPRLPEVLDGGFLNDSDPHDLWEEIRLVYRMVAYNRKQVLDLVCAMGCGPYGCPPRQVAEETKAILFDEEFTG